MYVLSNMVARIMYGINYYQNFQLSTVSEFWTERVQKAYDIHIRAYTHTHTHTHTQWYSIVHPRRMKWRYLIQCKFAYDAHNILPYSSSSYWTWNSQLYKPRKFCYYQSVTAIFVLLKHSPWKKTAALNNPSLLFYVCTKLHSMYCVHRWKH